MQFSNLLVHLCLTNTKLGRSGLLSRQRGPLAFLGLFPVSLIPYFTHVLKAHDPCKTSSLNSSQPARDAEAAPQGRTRSVKSFSGDQHLPWDIHLLLSQAGMAACTINKEGYMHFKQASGGIRAKMRNWSEGQTQTLGAKGCVGWQTPDWWYQTTLLLHLSRPKQDSLVFDQTGISQRSHCGRIKFQMEHSWNNIFSFRDSCKGIPNKTAEVHSK